MCRGEMSLWIDLSVFTEWFCWLFNLSHSLNSQWKENQVGGRLHSWTGTMEVRLQGLGPEPWAPRHRLLRATSSCEPENLSLLWNLE